MKNRLIATVLTLALLCPMLSMLLVTGASAALEVDDGTSLVSSSDIINEEWNFDDMSAGEVLTNGYIASHARGDFKALTKITENFSKPEQWMAVEDTENGGKYIFAENAYLGFEDDAKLLLQNTYEISWRMKLNDCTSSTTLLWWSDGETVANRRVLLRLSSDGYLGYSTTSSYTGQVFTGVKIEIGEDAPWYSFRARVSPLDGRLWLWLDGEIVLDGVVNNYLRDNAKAAEYSRVGIMYAWSNQSFGAHLDDIKITPVQIDEHIDFEMDEVPAIDTSWDFEDGTVASKGNVTVTEGSSYDIDVITGDTDNTTKTMRVMKADTQSTVTGPTFTLPGTIYDYEDITVSFRLKYNYSSSLVNVFRFIKADGKTQNLFRLTKMAKATEGAALPTANANFLTDNGTNAGILTNGVWTTFTVTIKPSANEITTVIGDKTATLSGNSTIKSIFSALDEGGKPFAFMLYYHINMFAEIYFDDISIKATPAPINSEKIVDSKWQNSTFDMTVPTTSGMANDDWTIASDPARGGIAALWDFEDGKAITAQTGTTITQNASNVSYGVIDGDNVNTTKVAYVNDKSNANLPKIKLGGTIRDYETINVSFKYRVEKSDNYLNIFRLVTASGGTKNVLRVGIANTDAVTEVRIGKEGTNPTNDSNTAAKIPRNQWVDINMTIKPAEGSVVVMVGQTEVKMTSTASGSVIDVIKTLYNQNKPLEFWPYLQSMASPKKAISYIDDLSITATHVNNKVLKTLPDAGGNVRAMLTIKDKEMYLANQPFEISFDYMMNQKPSGWLNFVKFQLTDTGFSVLRLAPEGSIWGFTSSTYYQYYENKSSDSGKNIYLNVASKTLTVDKWYNFRIVFDPNSGHIMGYIDNVLVSDFNINDVYIDANGAPLDVIKKPTKMLIELASQYSASQIKINDSCFDNLRIRTLNYNEYTKTFLTNTDFDSVATGELNANTFASATGLYSKTLGGSFVVAGMDDAKYVEASVKAGDGISVDMTNGYAPLATEVVAFEGNFTINSFGTDGKLNLYSLTRGDKAAVTLLSVDKDGKLYLGETATEKVLNAGEIYTVKLVYSGVSGTGELYINDKFVDAAPIVAQADLPVLSYTDSMGNTVYVGNRKFLTSEDAIDKTLSVVARQSAEMPDPTKVAYEEDTLTLFSVEGSGTWGVIFDDISIYRDENAHVYADNQSTALVFSDASSTLWGNSYIAEFTYSGNTPADIASLVDWTLGDTVTSLVKVGGGKLYAADGTTELVALTADIPVDIAIAVGTHYWENHIKDNNYSIDVTVYVNGSAVGSYTAVNTTATTSGALAFADGTSGAKVYFGNMIRDNRSPADASGVKFEGYNAFSTTFEDESFFDNAESNVINYVDWAYPDCGKTITDNDDATVKIAEYMNDEAGKYFRIRRPEASSKPVAYMEYNLGAMGEYVSLYSAQMDIRYTDPLGGSLNVATLFDKNLSGKLTLLSVAGDGRFYFINNGVRYYLANSSGNNIYCKTPSDDSFTSVAVVVNSEEGHYSIWIDGTQAYYYGDGLESGAKTIAHEIPINYTALDAYTICEPKIRLFEGTNITASESIADVDNISIDIIKNGLTPVLYGYQISDVGDDIRFIATVDTLYNNTVGFEILAISSIEGEKSYTDSSSVVFSSVDAEGETVAAETLGGRYVAALAIRELKVAEYSFTVTPFVEVYGEKIYGESATYTYDFKEPTPAE